MNAALLSHRQVAAMLGLKRDALYKLRHTDPTFPKPLDLPGLSHPKWTPVQIEAWVESKLPARKAS